MITPPPCLPKEILRTVGVVPNRNVDVRYLATKVQGIRHRGKASATPKLSSLAKTHRKPMERGVDLFPALAMEIELRTTSKVVAGLAHGKVSKASTWLWKPMLITILYRSRCYQKATSQSHSHLQLTAIDQNLHILFLNHAFHSRRGGTAFALTRHCRSTPWERKTR